MTLGTPDSPRPVTPAHRGRRYFTRTAGLALLTPAIIATGIALAGGASAAEPSSEPGVQANTESTTPDPTTSESPAPDQQEEAVCPEDGSDITGIQYLIDGTAFSTLNGHAYSGATVQVVFTVADGCTDDPFSLVAYKAPAGVYSPDEATQQVLSDSDTDSFSSGEQTLTVTLPTCFYQVDFVRGAPIENLTADAYSNAGHLIDHDNGGTTACTTPTTTPTPNPTETPTVLGTTVTKDPVTVAAASASLPFTGGATQLLLALGSSLVAAGIALRVAATRRFARRH